ncbi:hypothetical protein [Cupriavidus sp. RAF12]|uniref:hypothetical protein n=1 Tax=Cupriavidus sp. RAF12 TaxID=3233050 RepID=UPI003F929F18
MTASVARYLVVAALAALATLFLTRNYYLLEIEQMTTAKLELEKKLDKVGDQATAKVRAAEQLSAYQLAQSVARLTKEKQDEVDQRDALIAQLRAGTLRMRDPGPKSVQAGGTGAQAGAGQFGDDGAGGAELSVPAGEFLLAEAARANGIVRKLTRCQGDLTELRDLYERLSGELEQLNQQ